MNQALDAEQAVPEAVRPPPGNPRFPLFDGLRAVAALLIVLNHGIFASGYSNTGALGRWTFSLAVGVPIFFAISGFLLYRPFVLAQMSGSSGPATLRFYRRRLLRIVPAYWVALTVLSIYPLSQDMFLHWPKYYFFLQVYTPSDYGISVAWSLCVEMGFYLILPAYVWIIGRTLAKLDAGRRMKLELCVLSALSAVSAALFYSAQYGNPVLLSGSVLNYLYWFAVGMALAVISVWDAQRSERGEASRIIDAIRRHAWMSWLVALLLFVVIGALAENPENGGYDTSGAAVIRWLVGPLVAVAAVLPAVFSAPRPGLPTRVLAWRPLAWVGLVSYAVFLWHNPVIAMISRLGWVHGGTQIGRAFLYVTIALAITIPIAALSYYYVERPFLSLKEVSNLGARVSSYLNTRFHLVAGALAAACGAVVAVVAAPGWFANEDFARLNAAANARVGLGYLTSESFSDRLAPGRRLVDWFVIQSPAHSWALAVAVAAISVALSTYLLALLLRRLGAPAALALSAAVIFGSWDGWRALAAWWARGGAVLPATAFAVAAMLAAVRWEQSRRLPTLLGALVLLAAALSFSVGAAIAAPLVIVALIVSRPPERSISFSGAFDQFRSIAAFALPALVISALAIAANYKGVVAATGAQPWISISWHWLVDGLSALAINKQPSVRSFPAPAALGGILVLAALAAGTIRGARSVWVWICALGLVVGAGLLVAYPRLAALDVAIIPQLGFHESDLLILAVLIPGAWLAAGSPTPRREVTRVFVPVACAIFAVAWISNGISTTNDLVVTARGETAHAAIVRLQRTLPPLSRVGEGVAPLDNRLPKDISDFGENQLVETINTFIPGARVQSAEAGGAPVVIDADGTAREIRLGPTAAVIVNPPRCLETEAASTFLGAGSEGTTLTFPRRASSNGVRFLTIPLASVKRPGELGIVFRPTVDGLPNEVFVVDASTTAIRALVPANATSGSLAAWQGISVCIGDPQMGSATVR